MRVWPVYTYVCIPHAYLVPSEVRSRYQIWKWSCRQLSVAMWVLGTSKCFKQQAPLTLFVARSLGEPIAHQFWAEWPLNLRDPPLFILLSTAVTGIYSHTQLVCVCVYVCGGWKSKLWPSWFGSRHFADSVISLTPPSPAPDVPGMMPLLT